MGQILEKWRERRLAKLQVEAAKKLAAMTHQQRKAFLNPRDKPAEPSRLKRTTARNLQYLEKRELAAAPTSPALVAHSTRRRLPDGTFTRDASDANAV